MAELAAALSAGGKIGGCLIEPIQRELGYLFCFNSNIQELETRLDQLKAAKQDVKAREDAQQRSWRTLGEAAKLWMDDANEKIKEADNVMVEKVELQKGCFSIKWCPNLKLRLSLGRKGKKLSLLLQDLLQRRDKLPLTGVDLPIPPINMRDYNGDAFDFDSRRKPMEKIMELLQDKETRLIGICGMGGIGKTTFANQLLQKVQDSYNHLFDCQVICTVSSTPDFKTIQQVVLEMLGGSSLKEIESEILRAQHLQSAFKNKKVIVLLDDVWEEFDLNAKGFPLRQPDGECWCKIIYTSRNKDLWAGQPIITKKEISLEVLSYEEAWNLFIRKAFLLEYDLDYYSKTEIAIKIVKECGRLPLALEVVGGSLIKRGIWEWNYMLSRLQNYYRDDDHKNKIHNVLETSYNLLEDPNAKFLFLLCCLFKEDEQIHIETLYRYAMSLHLFKGLYDLKRIRDCVYTIVENLIRRNLLIKDAALDGRERVKMHDVVRYVGISIAKHHENGLSFLMYDDNDENVIENVIGEHDMVTSVLLPKNYQKVLESMEFRDSKLELLRLDSSRIYPSDTKISRNFFQGADNLKVLDIVDGIISDFPDSSNFLNLANMKMLSMEKLKITTNISFIQHLSCLEVLSLRWSTIECIPIEVGELTNLRLLDLTRCHCCIVRGVLSRLTNLQELYLWGSFNKWKHIHGRDNLAELSELNCLHKLRRLELEIPHIELVPRGIKLFSSSTTLQEFKISIGGGQFGCNVEFENGDRQLWLENVEDYMSSFYAHVFSMEKEITNLYLCGNSGMWEKIMYFRRFDSLKDIVIKHDESLSLWPQSSLHIGSGAVRNLRRIEVYKCNKMRHLWSTYIVHLENLQILILENCPVMDEVINCDNQLFDKIEFSTLKILKICEMGMLKCFCKGIDEIRFLTLRSLKLKELNQFVFPTKLEIPCLEKLSIRSLPKIKNLGNIVAPSLKKLKILDCDNIIYVFSNSLAMKSTISSLKTLTIKNCTMLKGVVGVSKWIESIQFPNLTKLHLLHLNQLSSFVVAIENLNNDSEEPRLHTLFQYDDQVSFPCLQKLRILGLSNINYIVGWENQQHHHDDKRHQQPTLSSLFPILRKLEVDSLSNLVHFYQNNRQGLCLGVFLFENLTYLDIARCDKMRYLFSENIGRVATKHLEHLYMRECPMMEVVMKNEKLEDDGDKAETGGGEGIVSLPNTHFFPSLVILTLSDLSALTSFCDLAYAWALPSLNLLSVLNCPKLKFLCPGYLDSPRLHSFRHDDHDITKMPEFWKGDINSTLQHLFIKNEELASRKTVEQG